MFFLILGILFGVVGEHTHVAALTQCGSALAAFGAIAIVFGWLAAPTPTRYFYVSAIHPDGSAALVTGPYPSSEEAAADVDRVRAEAEGLDSVCWDSSCAWGVSESPEQCAAAANELLGFQPAG